MDFRNAEEKDVKMVYDWANDPVTRAHSFDTNAIPYENHVSWFKAKLKDPDHKMLIFSNEEGQSIGMIRFNKEDGYTVIGINIAPDHRGKSYASTVISMAVKEYSLEGLTPVYAYIKKDNIVSIKSFSRAGFQFEKSLLYNNINSVLYIWK